MGARVGGIGTVAVAAATVACGLLLLGGVAPSPADGSPGGAPIAPTGTDPDDDDPYDSTTTTPVDTSTTTTTTTTTTSTTTSTTVMPSTTTTTTTSTTTASTSTTTIVATEPPPVPTTSTTVAPIEAPAPLPLSVGQSSTVIGAGGTVDFDGTCPSVARDPLGPVVVDVITDHARRLDTGITSEHWTFAWTAPTDPDQIRTHTFQFWCGDPSGYRGGYPLDLQRSVDIVAQATATTTTVAPTGGQPPTGTIPVTG